MYSGKSSCDEAYGLFSAKCLEEGQAHALKLLRKAADDATLAEEDADKVDDADLSCKEACAAITVLMEGEKEASGLSDALDALWVASWVRKGGQYAQDACMRSPAQMTRAALEALTEMAEASKKRLPTRPPPLNLSLIPIFNEYHLPTDEQSPELYMPPTPEGLSPSTRISDMEAVD